MSPNSPDFAQIPKYINKPGDIFFVLQIIFDVKPWSSGDHHLKNGSTLITVVIKVACLSTKNTPVKPIYGPQMKYSAERTGKYFGTLDNLYPEDMTGPYHVYIKR